MKTSFKNIRLDDAEKRALLLSLNDIDGDVYMFGSRLNKEKKGGDIDLLIFSKKNSLGLSQNIRRRFFMECEEKIDVLVFDKNLLTQDQEAFINTLRLTRIK